MRASWAALAARARGLSTHLLSAEHAREVERAMTPTELDHALRGTPYARFTAPGDTGPATLELAVTRSLAERMTLLARWAGPDAGPLRAIMLDQDAHNVRDIVRGLLGGLAPERRAAGAIPTPLLGRKELESLAHAESPGAAAATLAVWGHPLGSALLDEASRKHPDGYRLEAALARRTAAETSRAARKGGRRVRAFVRAEIDAANAVAALLLAGARTEGQLADFFIEGGRVFTLTDFVRAASVPSRVDAAELLASAAVGSVFEAPLLEHPSTPSALLDRILSARIEELAARGRQEPVSAVPVLLFVLRLRWEAQLVRRVLWGVALAGGLRP